MQILYTAVKLHTTCILTEIISQLTEDNNKISLEDKKITVVKKKKIAKQREGLETGEMRCLNCKKYSKTNKMQ